MPVTKLNPTLRLLSRNLLDFILPPRCPVTGELVGGNGTVSPRAWSRLHFIRKPFCACCGNPFAHGPGEDDIESDLTCGACMRQPPAFARARAALKYDDASAAMILPFKHGDKTLLANVFATWLVQAGQDLFAGADYFIPVPLHRWRLLKRRYNQANLLAVALSRKTGITALPHLLRRKRHTESQGQKTKAQRLDNIAGAFAVADAAAIAGKNLILIDDVLTSGATVNEAAKVLLRHGAARVDVLCLARVGYGD